jgi:hypothetical protein
MTERTTPEHTLTHVQARTPQGPRLVPACTRGWWSADGSHLGFEKHLGRVAQAVDD